jgi:hypothetical protein
VCECVCMCVCVCVCVSVWGQGMYHSVHTKVRGQVFVGTGHIWVTWHVQQALSLPTGPPLVPNWALGDRVGDL